MQEFAEGVQPTGNCAAAVQLRRVKCELTEPLYKRILRKIFPDQRKQERITTPPLVGYLGSMRATKPYDVSDISLSGFCLLTDERWTPGTEMPITLERTNLALALEDDSFTVQATVVRTGRSGVGFSIVLNEEESNAVHDNPLQVRWVTRSEMKLFLRRIQGESEQAEVMTQAASEPSASAFGQAARQPSIQGAGD